MNICKSFLIILICNTNIYSAEQITRAFTVKESPAESEITATSCLIGLPKLPSGVTFKYLDKFKEFLAHKKKKIAQLNFHIKSNLESYNPKLSLSIEDCREILKDRNLCLKFTKRLFKYHMLSDLINLTVVFGEFGSQAQGILCNVNSKKFTKKSTKQSELNLFTNLDKIQKSIANYQQKKDISFISTTLSDRNLLTQLFSSTIDVFHKYQGVNDIKEFSSSIVQLLHESLEMMISDFLSIPFGEEDTDNNPCLKFLDEQIVGIQAYYRLCIDLKFNGSEIRRILEEKFAKKDMRDSRYKFFFGKSNFNYIDVESLIIFSSLPLEFKDIFKAIFRKTNSSKDSDLICVMKTNWGKPIPIDMRTLPLTLELVSQINPTPSDEQAEGEVDLLMQIFKLQSTDDHAQDIKKDPKSKSSNEASAAEDIKEEDHQDDLDDEDDDEDDQDDEIKASTVLSKFNRSFYTKKITLDERISDWYHYKDKECAALRKQGYLDPASDRYLILRDIMSEGKTEEQAIQEIIFRHQLPYSLIKNIVLHGTIRPDSTSDCTYIASTIKVTRKEKSSIYIGEINGNVYGEIFKVWHSFLRPTRTKTSIPQENRKEDKSGEYYTTEDDARFTILREQEGWTTQEDDTSVTISRDDIQYTLFKS
jgi:hypothetical protein